MRGLFVTGTDTEVGKTVLSAALIAAISAAGEAVRAYKPVLTGLEQTAATAGGTSWPPDHELLAHLAGMSAEEVTPLRYGPMASPHLAAQLAGERIDPEELAARARATPADTTLIVEGVGGVLVPLDDAYTVCDLAADLELPLLIASRPGLGTINHTLLTLKAAREARLDVRAVVLTPWPPHPDEVLRSNRQTIERLGDVEVATLGPLAGPGVGELAEAGATLPWRRWLDPA